MKKMIFSASAFALVAVSSMALAPTTAEAIPAFARQTGAACLSCHFQTFPALTSFGRAFKQGAFTDVGDQALVEDDNLSIPAVLNATVVVRPQVTSVSTYVGATGVTTRAKAISYGDQVVLIAGRVGTNTGAFVELGGGAFGNHQLLNSWDVGDVKVGASYYNTGFGEDAGVAVSNVWGQHGAVVNHRFVSANHNMFKGGAVGAGQIAGASVWVANDMGNIQIGLIAPSDGVAWGADKNSTHTAAKMGRISTFLELGDYTLGLGGIGVTGDVGSAGQFIAGKQLEMKRYGLDGSLEGSFGDTEFGIYADYANASKSTTATTNEYNASLTDSLNGYGLAATVKPLHNVILGVGVGQLKSDIKTTYSVVGLTYEIYQNFEITLTFDQKKTTTALGAVTKVKGTTLDIEALM
ncbi:MAG: hypothetical protein R8K53_04230 [Mariprofundaceae bacterium]